MAEGAPLLREYTLIAYRGFESLLLRHLIKKGPSGPFFMMLSGRLEEGYRTQTKSDGLQPASANATYFHLFRIFL